MAKPLSEMSLTELWQLFPIFLTEYQEHWPQWYEQEAAILHDILGKQVMRISHIGSTAIKGIWAKPIIDILVEITPNANIDTVGKVLSTNGYIIMSANQKRISFNKGYTENGYAEKVYHIHLRYDSDNDELYFRDYLNEHSSLAAQYEQLKRSLWEKYQHNRDGYTDAKASFISDCTRKAKLEYKNRY